MTSPPTWALTPSPFLSAESLDNCGLQAADHPPEAKANRQKAPRIAFGGSAGSLVLGDHIWGVDIESCGYRTAVRESILG